MEKQKVADLFCGAGGFSAGFKEAGFDIIFGIDNNKSACATFKENFSSAEVICSDIMEYKKYPQVDVLIGSPPCVEFSKGNINRSFDTKLINRMLEIVEQINPKYWILENVPDAYDYVNAPVKFFFDAYNFGAATNRKRLFAGKYPFSKIKTRKGLSVRQAININRCGYRQPYKDNVYRKIDPDRPFVTLCSQRISNERYLLPNGSSLDVTEMAIIQGFPSWFIFPCSRSEMQRQIGNSVSPKVAEQIAKAIMHDRGTNFTKSSADDFPYQESLISVKRESADSPNSPHDLSTKREEANFS